MLVTPRGPFSQSSNMTSSPPIVPGCCTFLTLPRAAEQSRVKSQCTLPYPWLLRRLQENKVTSEREQVVGIEFEEYRNKEKQWPRPPSGSMTIKKAVRRQNRDGETQNGFTSKSNRPRMLTKDEAARLSQPRPAKRFFVAADWQQWPHLHTCMYIYSVAVLLHNIMTHIILYMLNMIRLNCHHFND